MTVMGTNSAEELDAGIRSLRRAVASGSTPAVKTLALRFLDRFARSLLARKSSMP